MAEEPDPAKPATFEAAPAVRWPWLKDIRPRSARHPWSRSVLGVGILFLLPFVWVLEVEECGSHASVELTGDALFARFDTEAPETWVFFLAVVFCLAAPWIAAAMVREAPRFFAHVLGLLASLATSTVIGAMFFLSLFSTRVIRPAGYVVLTILVLLSVDALVRLVFSVQELVRSRRPRPPR